MKKNIIRILIGGWFILALGVAVVSRSSAQTESTGSEFLTLEQLGNAKKLMARLGIPGMTVDEVIDDYEMTRQYAYHSYVQHKKLLLWLQDSGVTVEELGELADFMISSPTPETTP